MTSTIVPRDLCTIYMKVVLICVRACLHIVYIEANPPSQLLLRTNEWRAISAAILSSPREDEVEFKRNIHLRLNKRIIFNRIIFFYKRHDRKMHFAILCNVDATGHCVGWLLKYENLVISIKAFAASFFLILTTVGWVYYTWRGYYIVY